MMNSIARANTPLDIVERIIGQQFKTEGVVSRSKDDHEDVVDPKENLIKINKKRK